MIQELKEQNNPYSHVSSLFETLYCIGNIKLLKQPKIAIVGTRHPNAYTKVMTHQLSNELSKRGITIVSGAAIGVDAIAHSATVNFNTIAVVANGLNIKYPAINKTLIQSIENNGLMLSAFKENEKARSYTFVQRNELVVVMSDAVIITQADLNSGSLTSAKFALKHKKPIYVLPHRLNESLGTQKLLQDNSAQAIYNIEAFCAQFGKQDNVQDELLSFCKTNPNYEQALLKFEDKILEYELEGKIRINNGLITVV